MSTTSFIENGYQAIEGDFACVYLFMSLDEYYGTLTKVCDEDGEVLFTAADPQEAEDWATNYADNGSGPDDEPSDGFLSDANAGANALASIGWGTDEDCGDGNFDE